MRQTIRSWVTGLKNLRKWLPIIWKDRDWDDHFIWEILKFKLQNQSKYIGHHDRHTTAKRDAEIMMTCVRLIEKIQTEYYSSEYMDYCNDKFHFDDIPGKPGYKELRIEEVSERFDEYFKMYPRIHEQVLKMEKAPFRKTEKVGVAMNVAYINHKRAKKLLFKILEDNIESWWD